MKKPSLRRPRPPVPGRIDIGIRRAVELLQLENISTFESCEGGSGHAYTEPTVAFTGTPAAGWRALAICFDYGLPVAALRRVWVVQDGIEPDGARWELVFRHILDPVGDGDGQLAHSRAMATNAKRDRVAALVNEKRG